MEQTVLIITWISLGTIFYIYLGYPLLLRLLCLMGISKKRIIDPNYCPSVSLVVSCYNEIDVVKDKIENSLALHYPKEKLDIVIVSDGSDDGTDEVAQRYHAQGVRLVRQEGRLGKTMAINLAMKSITSEVVVFSDANAMYQPDAIAKLVRNLADPNVGYVVGAAIYTDGNENAAANSENSYWEYELKLKHMESELYSVVGGDGAIYGIKRALYKELDQKDINDFVNPLEIIAQGYRGVFEREAVCLEETAGDFKKEARRKQRIVNRSFRGLMKVKTVMNPFKFGFFSFEVISHKLLRWLMPVFIVLFALGAIVLAYAGQQLFQLISLLGLSFLVLAQIGFFKSNQVRTSPLFYYPYYFMMVNYYSLIGVVTAMAGNIQVTWSSPRQQLQHDSKHSLLWVFICLVLNLGILKISVDLLTLLFA